MDNVSRATDWPEYKLTKTLCTSHMRISKCFPYIDCPKSHLSMKHARTCMAREDTNTTRDVLRLSPSVNFRRGFPSATRDDYEEP